MDAVSEKQKYGAMDDLDWIRKGLEKPGKTQTGLAEALGVSPSAVTMLLKGDKKGKRRLLKAHEIPKAAVYLEAEPPGSIIPPPNASPATPIELGGLTVPLMGQGACGRDGRFEYNGQRISDILAPPALARVKGAYAVYAVGESMLDRYQPGEVVFVDPNRPVIKGHFVVAQIRGDHDGDVPGGYIKRFVSMDDRVLRLEQLNPKKILTFPRKKVIAIHKIIMGGDG